MAEKKTKSQGTKSTRSKKSKNQGPCWPGYHLVPGRKPFTKGSCAKNSSKKSSAAG